MSINGILATAASALSTNQAALRTTSTNVANVNNSDYVRRDVILQTLTVAGSPLGVKVGEVRRIAAEFLAREIMSSRSASGMFDAMNDIHNRLQGLFGRPDDPGSMPSLINQALAFSSELTLDPVSIPRRMGYLQQVQAALDSLSHLSAQVQQVRADADSSVAAKVSEANRLIGEIYDVNNQVAKARGTGQDDSALQDQLAADLRQLSDLISIRTFEQPNGAIHVMTEDGFALVTESKVQLSYTAAGQTGSDVVYDPISVQSIDPNTGLPTGTINNFDSHIAQGSLRGMLAMRDNDLPNLMEQLGELGAQLADQINAVHADSVAVPPVNTLQGRNTGLLSGDAAGFTGTTTLAVVASDGSLVRKIDLDFTAGTYSVNGGAPVAFGGTTLGDIVSSINTALAGVGTASFSNGALTIDATNATDGVGFLQPDTGGSSRGGRSFSHFFGLNDLVQAFRPSHFDTGLVAGDASGFANGQQIDFVFRGPDGKIAKQFTYTTTAGDTIGDIITDLNNSSTGLGSYLTFALDSSGHLSATPTGAYQGYQLDISGDNTDRGGTGVSFTALFGIGRRYQMEQARDLGIDPAILQQPTSLALAHLDIDGTTVPGDIVATVADGRGAEALTALTTGTTLFNAAGDLRAMATTIGDYASLVIGNVSSNAASVDRLDQAANSVRDEVEFRRKTVEGVNLDEELSNMVIYQQAYNAAARLVTVAQQLYDALLSTVQ